jgi:hypothetical protein
MGKGTVTKGSSVKYGSGQYDSTPHGGKGKEQKLLPPAAGEGYNKPTPHTNEATVRDGVEGKGSRKRGYQMDAHSGLYHGPKGEAVGHSSDLRPMEYDHPLYSEGGEGKEVGNVGTGRHHSEGSGKAEHHPPAPKTAHIFPTTGSAGAHGFGHTGSQRQGVLRMSGHTKGHQIGKR